jgi:uncharacterized protein YcbK (DUF882 family)
MNPTRRSFLTHTAATVGAIATSSLIAAPALALRSPTIALQCAHTGRACEIVNYDGALSTREADAFRAVTQDWRANKVFGMDLRLVDILSGISKKAQSEVTTALISGYRTPGTNMKLNGTATGSLHMKGRAMDIRYPGLTTRELRDIARSLRAGGVGYYPQAHNRFVHIDTGRVRYW